MPFDSRAQAGYLWATNPTVARKMAHHSGLHDTSARKKGGPRKTSKASLNRFRALPYHVKKKASKKKSRKARR